MYQLFARVGGQKVLCAAYKLHVRHLHTRLPFYYQLAHTLRTNECIHERLLWALRQQCEEHEDGARFLRIRELDRCWAGLNTVDTA